MRRIETPPPALDLHGFPRAIMHFDGDAFFTSVEQAIHPELRGRPVVTGKERGIIACASYEAKALGIQRGVALWEARARCPELVVLPSDYETYSLFSKRMFEIARRFTPTVEEYSIDEGFADITGLRRVHRASYEDIARRFQQTVAAELDITVSIGLSLSKSLAKLASKFRKPRGFTAVAGEHVPLFLQRRSLSDVWGFGPNSVALLRQFGLATAWDFAARPEAWAERHLGKIGRELWNELRGVSLYPVNTEAHTVYATISKGKTFTSPSSDREFIYAKLVRNAESACIKLRRHGLRARAVAAALRKQDYAERSLGARLTNSTASAQALLPALRVLFDALYEPGAVYRATLVWLGEIECDPRRQGDLFEDPVRVERLEAIGRAVDRVNAMYGKHHVALGTGLFLPLHRHTERDEAPERRRLRLPGENDRRRLAFPLLGIRV